MLLAYPPIPLLRKDVQGGQSLVPSLYVSPRSAVWLKDASLPSRSVYTLRNVGRAASVAAGVTAPLRVLVQLRNGSGGGRGCLRARRPRARRAGEEGPGGFRHSYRRGPSSTGVERRYAPAEAAVVIGKIAFEFPRRRGTCLIRSRVPSGRTR